MSDEDTIKSSKAAKATKTAKTEATSSSTSVSKETVEAEKKAIDEIITKASSAADKKKALDEIAKKAADDIIKRKPTNTAEQRKAAEEIKKNAAEAKKHAQVKILGQTFVSDPNDHLERLADTFDQSARRWEMVVYPTLFAFILLAGYGFFLIYRLTQDMHVLSESVTRMATIVSDATPKVIRDMSAMSGNMDDITQQMNSLPPMNQNLANITNSMATMNRSVYGMQRDIGGMNRTVSGGPFGFMKDAMPFTSNSYTDPPPPLPPLIPQQQMMPPQGPLQRYPQPQGMSETRGTNLNPAASGATGDSQ